MMDGRVDPCPRPANRGETDAVSTPGQPAPSNWFARLSPVRQIGLLIAATLLLCFVGAAGFVALLPGEG